MTSKPGAIYSHSHLAIRYSRKSVGDSIVSLPLTVVTLAVAITDTYRIYNQRYSFHTI